MFGSSRSVRRVWMVAPLLFGSGFCGLVEQVAWEREFRLVFGMTTAASAAVVAIFIGGLGLGSVLLGKRADRHPKPLHFYGNLELGVAAFVALTPLLLHAVRIGYAALGGTSVLGQGGGELVRLLFAALVLGPPTVLMGGTLPAAARAVETTDDDGRGATGVLYGTNTVGAVLGALGCSLFMVEVFGNRASLWIAALVSALVGLVARALARSARFTGTEPPRRSDEAAEQAVIAEKERAPWWIVVVGAALVGFAFFLMELVAPRMLGPLLGGTVFTFGLVLAVALAGVGLGGLLYGQKPRAPRLSTLGVTCALEALAFSVPLVLGDRLALLALRLRPLHDFGFGGYVTVAVLITSVVLLPAAIVSGYQFPLLIGLLGSGREKVGRDVGRAYAANTVGAVLGALAGGFWLMPQLSAPGCWRLVIVLLACCGIVMATADFLRSGKRRGLASGVGLLGVLAMGLAFTALGPTAVWRHGGVGAGRASAAQYAATNLRKAQTNKQRASVLFERDGREASVALLTDEQITLFASGKADGSSRTDAATQVGSGLLQALRHPQPRRALVVGLATGCTAGWLAKIPSIERVDVLEIEPVMVDVARALSPVNEQALDNPKVHVILEDAREHLLTSREHYDLIVSEPSNPYRAGVATLYTQELYAAVARRLNPRGLFGQWVQAYEVDAAALRIAFSTVASVFPHTELWELSDGDLMMLSSQDEPTWNLQELEQRTMTEPYRRGLRVSMGLEGATGMLAKLRARDRFVHALADEVRVINTDDQNLLEFSFARTLGKEENTLGKQLLALSRAHHMDAPPPFVTGYDRSAVMDEVASLAVTEGYVPLATDANEHVRIRSLAKQAYAAGNCAAALAHWKHQPKQPRSPVELLLYAECATDGNLPDAERAREALGTLYPSEAKLLQTRASCGRATDARCVEQALEAVTALREDPWVVLSLGLRTLQALHKGGLAQETLGVALADALSAPFAARNFESTRRSMQTSLAAKYRLPSCRGAYEASEPHPVWAKGSLASRVQCYERTGSPWLSQARRELQEFLDGQEADFNAGGAEDDGL